ncbi:MAG: NAD-dependent epimerase/dehydratase family protein [Chloroflexi bacterium]|nr:NAD-dependent epimerase/dehydratase family protein [Chloroflexota bacterium]
MASSEAMDGGTYTAPVGTPMMEKPADGDAGQMLIRDPRRLMGGDGGTPMQIRVLIADDDPAFRLLARRELDRDPRFSVLHDAGDGAEAVSLASREKPDLVLMDIRMPVMDGVEATRRILEANPNTAVVFVSSFADLDPASVGARAKIDKSEFSYQRIIDVLGAEQIAATTATSPAVEPAETRPAGLTRVVVTGGSGRLGQYVVSELLRAGYQVVNADRAPGPAGDAPFIRIDATDFGDVVSALAGADAVIHLAAIPSPTQDPEYRVFALNMQADWNVLEAAQVHGVRKLVMASSVNAVGAVFSKSLVPPLYFPIDEEHPTRAEDAYSQSKWLGEELARGFCRRREVQIASMRFHGLWDHAQQRTHKANPHTDPGGRPAMHFWGWLDRWDAARACRLAIELDWTGHKAFFLNASDTTLTIPTEEAIGRVYPGVPLRRPLPGFSAAIDVSHAERVLGWRPERSWRDG